MTTPTAPGAGPIERKVTAATVATYLGSVGLLAVLNGVADTNLVTALPDIAEVFIAPMVPAAIALVAGYIARHTPR